jgi:hypothetical protein
LGVDSLDNIYVTGYGSENYATLKYDTDGNELWVKRYDSGGYDMIWGCYFQCLFLG